LHIKNPVGDFSPTGFVEQPEKKDSPKSTSYFEKSLISYLFG